MATYTQNYGFIEPDYGEYGDVDALNDNMESIDSLIYQGRRMAVGGYDSTATYNTGDLVEYSNALYRCKEDGVTGTWDSTKWELTTLADEIESKGEGGADVTKKVSGNPVEFDDGADAPLVKCVSAITGSQDLHGYDKPWVGGSGKNKLNIDDTTTTQAGYIANGLSFIVNSGTYTFSFESDAPSNTEKQIVLSVRNSSDTEIARETISAKSGSVTFTTSETSATVRVYTTYIGSFSNFMIEEGSTATTFTPYSNICPITAYTEGEISVDSGNYLDGVLKNIDNNYCVFGGTTSSDIPDGSLTVDAGVQTFLCSETVNVISVRDSSGTQIQRVENTDRVVFTLSSRQNIRILLVKSNPSYDSYSYYLGTTLPITHTTTYPSAIYRGSEDVVKGEVVTEWGMIASYAGETLPGEWISDRDEYAPGTTPTTGAQVAYKLATPTTSSVTTTNLPIKSLSGYNQIESSTGEMEVEYITEDFQPIVDLIEANASEPYSDDYTLDTEIEVGTWVDGSTLYRKTKEITGMKNAGYEGTIYTAGSGEHIVKLDGCIYNDYYSGMAYPINMAYSTNNGTMAFSTYVTGSDAETVLFKNGWNSSVSKIYLVVYYIKSSS